MRSCLCKFMNICRQAHKNPKTTYPGILAICTGLAAITASKSVSDVALSIVGIMGGIGLISAQDTDVKKDKPEEK